ncbi:MAG: hypothetical protein EZS28_029649 [Streblomastix strix]|uniref:Uncharacterized protein n=1 Tax=Streblomastix strix TaxID=222440 RepID=A0A5J4UX58_9EUKA|nr:MAG: hypothetical protein EZS28_029649 [Streblomastix strix]
MSSYVAMKSNPFLRRASAIALQLIQSLRYRCTYQSIYVGRRSIRFIDNGDLEHVIRCDHGRQVSCPVEGNQSFDCGQRVSVEIDLKSSPRKAVLFIDGVQQKNYVIGIPKKIRVFAFVQQKGSSFHVTEFERLAYSSARIDTNSVAWKWGKDWKQN